MRSRGWPWLAVRGRVRPCEAVAGRVVVGGGCTPSRFSHSEDFVHTRGSERVVYAPCTRRVRAPGLVQKSYECPHTHAKRYMEPVIVNILPPFPPSSPLHSAQLRLAPPHAVHAVCHTLTHARTRSRHSLRQIESHGGAHSHRKKSEKMTVTGTTTTTRNAAR